MEGGTWEQPRAVPTRRPTAELMEGRSRVEAGVWPTEVEPGEKETQVKQNRDGVTLQVLEAKAEMMSGRGGVGETEVQDRAGGKVKPDEAEEVEG